MNGEQRTACPGRMESRRSLRPRVALAAGGHPAAAGSFPGWKPKTMITRLYADNYRCFVNFELHFDALSLLLGVNGVGKTSVLDIVFALRELLGGRTAVNGKSAFPASTLTRWRSRSVQIFEMDVELEGSAYSYRLEVEHSREKRVARIQREHLTMNGGALFEFVGGDVQLYRDDLSKGPSFPSDWTVSSLARVTPGKDNRNLSRFQDFVRSIIVCGLHPGVFASESATEDDVLDRDGRNFVGWYRSLAQERPDLIAEYTKTMQDVLGGFRGIRLQKAGMDTRALMMVFCEAGEEYALRFGEVSDGQRTLVVLYALSCLAAGQRHTLFLDESMNFVALREVQPWLLELSDLCDGSLPQAVLASHHPEIVDYLGSDKGQLLRRESSGATRADRVATLLNSSTSDTGLKLSELFARGWES